MPVINYHSVDGLLLGETGASGRRDYLPDALGSTMGTADGTTGVLKNEYRYRPYGGFLLQGSAEPDPAFLWTGETGSRSSGAPHAGQYNRARTYARETGRWTSVDPLWPEESAFGYVMGNPVTWTDPEGERPQKPRWPKQKIVPRPGSLPPKGSPPWPGMLEGKPPPPGWWDRPRRDKCHGLGGGSGPGPDPCISCAQPISSIVGTRFQGGGTTNAKNNALRHCIAACEVAERCGTECAVAVSIAVEIALKNLYPPHYFGDMQNDLYNDGYGIGIVNSPPKGDCEASCRLAYGRGRLKK